MLRFTAACVLLLAALLTPASAHECDGTIINASNVTFTLLTSSVTHGTLSVPPPVTLEALTQATFQLNSAFSINDRIEYTFGYQATADQQPCLNSTLVLNGAYNYEYGSVSCSSSTVQCNKGRPGNMTVVVQNCSGWWANSYPTFTIEYNT
eukprot:TRINITY_DN7847_c0_g1_i1.p2 TRINITY_DN7847_c0_g1~~TRINITY_DN7847_c0_g1_i1.p2  ORF type:complete len:167 (-),score=49.02 TRINITY_DN7847_c0_g1_i1:237-689(-)